MYGIYIYRSCTKLDIFFFEKSVLNLLDIDISLIIKRFTVVAELSKVWWLEIKATINFRTLSANTKYGAYLIYKTTPDSVGLHVLQEASVSVGSIQEKKNVCLKESRRAPRNRNVVGLPVEKDGWMELELGQFECDNVTDDKKAEISIMETDGHNEKRGLIVAGIEIRPI